MTYMNMIQPRTEFLTDFRKKIKFKSQRPSKRPRAKFVAWGYRHKYSGYSNSLPDLPVVTGRRIAVLISGAKTRLYC